MAEKIDRATLGLASALTIGALGFENISPTQWNKASLVGTLVYGGADFAPVQLRGAQMRAKAGKKDVVCTSGSQGEFQFFLFNLVDYSRFRLFPIIFESGQRFVKMTEGDIELTIESSQCNSSTRIHNIPTEPVTIILVPQSP